MIVMPQWTDQTTNAKLIEDIWKIGLRVPTDDRGIFRREALKITIKEIMESEVGIGIKKHAIHLKNLLAKAVDEGGSSHMILQSLWIAWFIQNKLRNIILKCTIMWCNM